jgi:polyhydroxybutyrate depolymerase
MIPSRSSCLSVARWSALASVLVLPACGSSGGGGGTGGSTNTGGNSATGGTTGTGTGGTTATGGSTGTGGRVTGTGGSATGGVTGTGGSLTGTGGSLTGTGGSATGGAGGGAGNGGTGSGGTAGHGTGGSSTGGTGGASTVTCPASSTLKAGDNNETITSGGESRTFIVHVPSSYNGSTPASVVLDFHPLGGTGSQQEGSSGWKGQCDSVGCIAVFPDSSKSKASDNSWNAGYCCTNAEKNQVDDVQFARDIVKWLQANACVDAKRIYASGGSNGGGMTYRLACEAADMVAAVAPVDFRCVTGKDPLANAGSVTAASNTACVCKLPRPISVVAYDEATDNSVVPYQGAQTPSLATDCPPGGTCVGIGFPGAVVNAQTWAAFDGCGSTAAAYSGNSICQQYPSCMANTTVMLCTNNSSSHLAAYSSSTAKVAATAWGVFKDQTLP